MCSKVHGLGIFAKASEILGVEVRRFRLLRAPRTAYLNALVKFGIPTDPYSCMYIYIHIYIYTYVYFFTFIELSTYLLQWQRELQESETSEPEYAPPYNLPLVSREWKNGSNSSYNCTHSSIPY